MYQSSVFHLPNYLMAFIEIWYLEAYINFYAAIFNSDLYKFNITPYFIQICTWTLYIA